MGKFLKPGKVVIVLQGRFAGRKAVIVKTFDAGSAERRFGHCLVAGVAAPPKRVKRGMSKRTVKGRSRVRPFLRYVNYNHIMPTRYVVDIDLKTVADDEPTEPEARLEAKKQLREIFQTRYLHQETAKSEKTAVGVAFLFEKLRF
eukprot:PLAT11850.1.p1 GENE.PLAT11850.1~~PLAT11850.1.p1  ORF type:complete len:160 (-),score=57.67 PLAT11850.1:200-634(-)